VADQVGAAALAVGRHTAAYLYGYWPVPRPDGYHWFYGRRLTAGIIPTNGGLACVFVAGPTADIATALRQGPPRDVGHRLAERIDSRLARLVAGPSDGSVRAFRGKPAVLRQSHGPGWALVGDAGWWKDPLSTHGITDALCGAELLAHAIVAGAGSEHALRAAMRHYQDRRDRTAYAMHPIVDRLASHDWDLVEVRGLLRELSSVMAEEVDRIRVLDRASAATP
jgi:flavin-dependent dehydrogenase